MAMANVKVFAKMVAAGILSMAIRLFSAHPELANKPTASRSVFLQCANLFCQDAAWGFFLEMRSHVAVPLPKDSHVVPLWL